MPEGSGQSPDAIAGAERLQGAEVLDALARLLERYPEAPVVALREDGIIVPMPAEITLHENPVLEGRAGSDLIELDEESMEGWERILERGGAVYRVHPATRRDVTWTIFGLDLREQHGVIFMLAEVSDTAGGGDGGDHPVSPADIAPRAPRCATLHKDALAVIRYADTAALQMLGWEPDDLIGHRSTDFIHEDDQELARDAWMEMLANPGPGRRVRVRHRCSDGLWVWLEVTNRNLLHDPEYGCVLCELVDISEEMAAHELLTRLAETVPVGLLQLDGEGSVVYSNDRLHEILGVPRAETLPAQFASVLPEHQELVGAAFEHAVLENAAEDLEIELTHPQTGATRYCTVGLRALDGGTDASAGAIVCVADITDSISMREELRRLSMYDELTQCLNRRTIVRRLQEQIAMGGAEGARAVVFIDLDCFKPINDEHGHAAGDELLREIARRLRQTLRTADAIGRMGGDEFLIVCPDVASEHDAMRLAERTARVQAERMCLANLSLEAHVSIGVAWSQGEEISADDLIARADEAMYASKRQGEGKPTLFAPGGPAGRPHARRPQRTRASSRSEASRAV
jgi:diguanylate cyclase (GGDEF)-like protein/PAS domain S-box-containing protein